MIFLRFDWVNLKMKDEVVDIFILLNCNKLIIVKLMI